jgi:hypothetical protein
MAKPVQKIAKAGMSERERDLRSRLAQLVSGVGMVHGTLDMRGRTCGKSSCKCTRGEKHVSLYVVVNEGGQTRHLYVPKSHEGKVRRWAEHYRHAQELLKEISDIYRDNIRKREE